MSELSLEVVEGAEAGRQVELSGPVELGRDPQLQVILADEQVSRRHARIRPSNGSATLEDLGSTNGTYVNDQPIEGPRALAPGDRVRLGLTVLELRSAQQVAARPSAVQPAPQITRLGQDVLRPAREQDLPAGAGGLPPPVEAPDTAPPAPAAPAPAAAGPAPQQPAAPQTPPAVRAREREPGFVPPEALGDLEAESDFNALASLIDTRVKRQTNIALFAILAIAALALLVFFGAR